jgi:hypothetical protein
VAPGKRAQDVGTTVPPFRNHLTVVEPELIAVVYVVVLFEVANGRARLSIFSRRSS